VPSTPPPLPRGFGEPCRINRLAVLTSVFASFALVAGIFAWIATHPRKAAPPPPSASVAAIDLTAEPLAPPAPPQARVFSATPAFHRSQKRDEIASNIPLMEVNPPSLPPPASPEPKQNKDPDAERTPPWQLPPPSKQPGGETYGTQVLFLNNRETAIDAARREHKLLFVMHISGNFEESCFT